MFVRRDILLMISSLIFGVNKMTETEISKKLETNLVAQNGIVSSPPLVLNQFDGITFKQDKFDTFDGAKARELAMLVQESYIQFVQQNTKKWTLPNGYQLIQELTHDNKKQIFGFIARKDQDLYIIIRGTRTIYEWYNNTIISYTKYVSLDGKAWGETTRGFYSIYLDLRQDIENAIKLSKGKFNRVFISGHSLGGALATLALPDLLDSGISPSAITVYTFASPRAGDRNFSQKINNSGVLHWRIANTEDIVPSLPGSTANIISPNASPDNFIVKLYNDLKTKGMKTFEHTGLPIYFTIGTNSIEDNHNLSTIYMKGIGQPPI
jgi:hypothetical protein